MWRRVGTGIPLGEGGCPTANLKLKQRNKETRSKAMAKYPKRPANCHGFVKSKHCRAALWEVASRARHHLVMVQMKFWRGVSFVFSAISTCFNAQSICQPNNIVEQKDQTLNKVSVLRSSLDCSPQAKGSLMLQLPTSLWYTFALCLKMPLGLKRRFCLVSSESTNASEKPTCLPNDALAKSKPRNSHATPGAKTWKTRCEGNDHGTTPSQN